MAVRLCNENLNQVPAFFSVPSYDRSQVTSGILHIGPSNFFRAHLAVYADRLLEQQHKAGQPLTWGITAVSMKTSHVRDDIAPQDFLYTLSGRGKGIEEANVIGSVRDILVAQENPQNVLAAALDPNIKVVSLTVTQKGYYYSPNGGIDFNDAEIKADLAAADGEEKTAIGLIVTMLKERRRLGIAPPTIVSLDNFPNNGGTLRAAVRGYAEEKYPKLLEWFDKYVEFPVTMVDRITPGKTEEHVFHVAAKGLNDAHPVKAEPMPGMAFVIQNKVSRDPATGEAVAFPDFESVGALVRESVEPYELLKLRSLNGAHFFAGCTAHNLGHKYMHEAIQDPLVRSAVKVFWSEVKQTLLPTEGVDQMEFFKGLLLRLENDKIQDPLTRLARNGSQDKVRPRIVDPLREMMHRSDMTHGSFTFALASWIEYLKDLDADGYVKGSPRFDDKGKPIEPNDKKAALSGLLTQVTPDLTDPASILVREDLRFNGVGSSAMVQEEVQSFLVSFKENGVRATLENYIMTRGPAPVGFDDADNDNLNDFQLVAGGEEPRPTQP